MRWLSREPQDNPQRTVAELGKATMTMTVKRRNSWNLESV